MTDLPDVKPFTPPITPDVLALVIQGLGPGEYSVARLWPRYVAVFESHPDLRTMSTRAHLGIALKRAGFKHRVGHNHANLYALPGGTVSETPPEDVP